MHARHLSANKDPPADVWGKKIRTANPTVYLRNLWANLRGGRLSVLFGDANTEARDKAFAEFYEAAGHQGMIAYESTTAVPALVASAHGVLLDLGPGSGNQLARFDARRVTHAYGVEPNAAFVPAMAARLAAHQSGGGGDAAGGLGIGGDKYTLLAPCGLEDVDAALASVGVGVGELDCVVSMQVMVSFHIFFWGLFRLVPHPLPPERDK